LPSLSMATSAIDQNRGAAAPHESVAGAGWLGSRSLQLIPLIGEPKWHPSKKWEMGGASALGGCHSMGEYNNQP
jgi:hypothetical protein